MSRTALITGASSGIGAAFASRLAHDGYRVILVARSADRLEAMARQLGDTEALPADLTQPAGQKLVEDRIDVTPDLELLVNNAGFGTRGRFFEAPLESQDEMHRLHVLATVRLTHAALRGMVPRGRGAVINVSSVAGFSQSPGNTSYNSTKAWMNSFTEGLYLELKSIGSNVKVQALCPGFTLSEFHDRMGADRETIPARLWMRPDAVVDASLRGLAAGKLYVVPGAFYKILTTLCRRMPDSVRFALALRYARRMRRVRPVSNA